MDAIKTSALSEKARNRRKNIDSTYISKSTQTKSGTVVPGPEGSGNRELASNGNSAGVWGDEKIW